MANPSKAKGTNGETRVVNYLIANGFPARRLPLSGNKDRGDIMVTDHIMAEIKNVKTWSRADIYEWMWQTNVEQENGGHPQAFLIVLNHGKTVGQAWVISTNYAGKPMFMWLDDWISTVKGRNQ